MNDTATIPAAIETLAVPGARLHYEMRDSHVVARASRENWVTIHVFFLRRRLRPRIRRG